MCCFHQAEAAVFIIAQTIPRDTRHVPIRIRFSQIHRLEQSSVNKIKDAKT